MVTRLVLVLLCATGLSAQTDLERAQKIQTDVNALVASLSVPPPISVPAGSALQAALDAAPAGATLVLAAGTYPGSVLIGKPVTLTAGPLTAGRVTPAQITAWIVGSVGSDAVTVTATGVTLKGIGVKSLDSTRQLVAVTGANFVGQQLALMGSPTTGQHRCLLAHSANGLLTDSVVDECWLPGRDAQAVGGWMDTNGWTFTNNYLGGGAEIVMFGGADAPSALRIPRNVTMVGNTLSKHMTAWLAAGAQLKNGLELKCIDGFVFTDNIVEYAGPAQGGYTLVLKSANQDGTAPFTVTQNVRIERNIFRHGGGGASFVGQDGSNPAIKMNHVEIRNNLFEADPTTAPGGGDGRGFIFQSAVDHLTLEANTLTGKNLAAEMYFVGPPPTALVLKNLKGILPKTSLYGVKIDADGSGLPAVQAWAPDAVIQVTATDTGGVGYPVP